MPQEQFIALLLAHTSLETTIPANMVAIGLDGRPNQKNILQLLTEWVQFRTTTVTRRSRTRLDQVQKRLHILEGRMVVLLNIDEVIRVIREADDPKADLMAQFGITEIQADDILEIRLRQLARLEAIRIEKEMSELKTEEDGLKFVLSNDNGHARYDHRRDRSGCEKIWRRSPYIDRSCRARSSQRRCLCRMSRVRSSLSKNGWIRQRTGHDVEMNYAVVQGWRSVAGHRANAYGSIRLSCWIAEGVPTACLQSDIPGGRSDGVPLASLLDMPPKVKAAVMCAASA
jgi:topoisomerase-4 subunit A